MKLILFLVFVATVAAVAAIFLTPRFTAIEILHNPTVALAYRFFDTREPPNLDSAPPPIRLYKVKGEPVVVSRIQRDALGAAFGSREPDSWENPAMLCSCKHDCALSFTRGRNRLEIILCLSCSTFYMLLDDTPVGGGNFKEFRPVVYSALRALFPGDEAIQHVTRSRLKSNG